MVSILVFSHAPTTRSSVPVDHCLQLWLALKANGSTNESASHWPRPLDPVPEAVDKPCLHDVTTPRNDVAHRRERSLQFQNRPMVRALQMLGFMANEQGRSSLPRRVLQSGHWTTVRLDHEWQHSRVRSNICAVNPATVNGPFIYRKWN